MNKFTFKNFSEIGLRDENQDSLYIGYNKENNIALALIADGLGGHPFGKLAANSVKDYISDAFENKNHNNWNSTSLEKWIKKIIVDSQKYLNKISLENEGSFNMGTTLTLLIIFNNEAFIVSAGDSRCYYQIDDKDFLALTRDHNYERFMKESKSISTDVKNKSSLYSAISPQGKVIYDYVRVKLESNQEIVFILTTDGIHDFIEVDLLKKLFSNSVEESKIDSNFKELINIAQENGSTDNLTIIRIKLKC